MPIIKEQFTKQLYVRCFMLRFFINLHGICYDVIFRTSIDRAVKVPTTEQCANILVSESIAAFIMQTERNIYAFPVGLPLFLWMLFSYFCIWFSTSLLHPLRMQKNDVQHHNHSDRWYYRQFVLHKTTYG